MIHENATARDLGFARLLVFGILLIDLLIDPVADLSAFPPQAFLPHGVLRLIPEDVLFWLLGAAPLTAFKWIYAAVLGCCFAGFGPRIPTVSLAVVGTVFFHGLARGFGGHVNHQELITLHSAIILLFFPCFDGLAVPRLWRARKGDAQPTAERLALYRLGMRTIALWIMLTYFFIAMARVSTGRISVYFTNQMELYAVLHSLKWNYWDFSMAKNLTDQEWLRLLLAIAFPLSTILELAAPFAVFVRRFTVPIVVSLVLFHVSILLFMNIFFWQNLVLLAVFWGSTHTASRVSEATSTEKGIVFFDGVCGLCNGFIRWVASRDSGKRFLFTPLQGETARGLGVVTEGTPESWSIVLRDGDGVHQRSTAILRIAAELPGWGDIARLGLALPAGIRDLCYSLVARVRYRVFGRVSECELPGPELKGRLLP